MGAFARVHAMPPFPALVSAIEEEIANKQAENIRAAEQAYQEVRTVDAIRAG
jgi:Pyruvate/2-oxoacid:ferredoxin oxidoreductase gamma subunit